MKAHFLFFALVLAVCTAAPLFGSKAEEILKGLNDIRLSANNDKENGQPAPKQPLENLKWSDRLANLADRSGKNFSPALRCATKPHAVWRFLYGEAIVSFFNGDEDLNQPIEVALAQWAAEQRNYLWGPQSDLSSSRNYLAIVAQNTTEVGCAELTKTDCPDVTGNLFRCVFNPRGNWPGMNKLIFTNNIDSYVFLRSLSLHPKM